MTPEELATDLRQVAAKLIRAADIMEGKLDDTIGFIKENTGKATNSTEGVTCLNDACTSEGDEIVKCTGDDCMKKTEL